MLISRYLALVATGLCLAAIADDYSSQETASYARFYTFSWPLGGDALKPRGGTTKGPEVTLATVPSPEWQAMQAPGLTKRERDRRAILAMAGCYRVMFDFLEVVAYPTPNTALAPYQSWGTEKVYVDRDDGDRISLVHILEMRIVQEEGSISAPFVTKHWRQTWQYEPAYVDEYHGGNRWQRRALDAEAAKGAWSQTVYQVDESPRYASVGRWQHTPNFSTWVSGDTWRPLPRREWSVRDDYQVLIGTNRHTVVATGWLHEENNLKAVVPARALDDARTYLGREYGVARYQRISDADFAAADRYYQRTHRFWDGVLSTWDALFARDGEVTLVGQVDQLGLFRPLFARADAIATDALAPSAEDEQVIRAALQEMGATP